MWNHHTFNWTGECSVCHEIQTAATSQCPVDDSPLVVGFKGWRWNPFSFRLDTACLQCSNNCGFTSDATVCSHDGTPIRGYFIRFRTSNVRVMLYNLTYLFILALSLSPAAYLFFLIETNIGFKRLFEGRLPHRLPAGSDSAYLVLLLCAAIIGFKFFWMVHPYWLWKFRRNFDLDLVARGEERLRELERR